MPRPNNIAVLFPRHCAMELQHNENALDYKTVGQWLLDVDDAVWPAPEWQSSEHRQRAISTNELWTLHWHPDTPVGSCYIAAPTFNELLEFAKEYSSR